MKMKTRTKRLIGAGITLAGLAGFAAQISAYRDPSRVERTLSQYHDLEQQYNTELRNVDMPDELFRNPAKYRDLRNLYAEMEEMREQPEIREATKRERQLQYQAALRGALTSLVILYGLSVLSLGKLDPCEASKVFRSK